MLAGYIHLGEYLDESAEGQKTIHDSLIEAKENEAERV